MNTIYFILLLFVSLIGLLVIVFFLSELYIWLRKKVNKPRIGLECNILDLLECDDYVCIEGKILRFHHFASYNESIDPIKPPFDNNKTMGGELAFDNPRGIGYIYYDISVLKKCEFVCGKYGVKWALSDQWVSIAEEKIKKN